MNLPDRFFSATVLGGLLHVQGVPDWGPWNSNRIDRFPENQIVPGAGDRMIRTREELKAIIREPTGVTPTRNIWIHERLEDEAQNQWFNNQVIKIDGSESDARVGTSTTG